MQYNKPTHISEIMQDMARTRIAELPPERARMMTNLLTAYHRSHRYSGDRTMKKWCIRYRHPTDAAFVNTVFVYAPTGLEALGEVIRFFKLLKLQPVAVERVL